MWLLWVGVLSFFASRLDAKGAEQNDPIYCYDCHYDPDTEKEATFSYQGYYPGYPKCAMDGTVDNNSIDKWHCNSGKCFIRRDPNGLVYRGCADPENLPWGVDRRINCEYQGQKPSLWWFCEGSQCNEGRFDSADICGESPGLLQGGNDDVYEETVHGAGENYPGDNGGYASGKYYEQPDSYGKEGGYGQNNNDKSHNDRQYDDPVSKLYTDDTKDSGDASKSQDYGKSYSKKGKEGDKGVDIYGIYTAEVAPMYPKKSVYHMSYNHWRMPYDNYYYYGKGGSSYGKHSYGDGIGDYSSKTNSPKQPPYKSVDPPKTPSYKSVDPPKQPSYKSIDPPIQPSYKSVKPPREPNYKSVNPPKEPSYKSVDPPKKPSYKSIDPPKQPSYKSVDPPKQPSYKSVDPPKQPSYKSVDPPKQPSYKSVDPPKQPSYKSVDPPKQPSYKSVDPPKQPSYKSVDPPKQPSYQSHDPPKKSSYPQPAQKSVNSNAFRSVPAPKSYKSFIAPVIPSYKSYVPNGKSVPSSGKKTYAPYPLPKPVEQGPHRSSPQDYSQPKDKMPRKPITQPIDYVHGFYQKEKADKAAEYEEYYTSEYAGIYDTNTAYEDQVNSGYTNTEQDEVYRPDEPYYQRQPVYNQDPKPGYDITYEETVPKLDEDIYNQDNDIYGSSNSANPCDGKCQGNPSGLFSHPEKSDWFIQCGNGMETGKTCSCCKPYYLRCPYGTTFDGVTRVCSKMSGMTYGESVEEPKYRYVEY